MSTKGSYDYRPRVHFTPKQMWMNDPNGMVYVDGVYHYFYQHYPKKATWGPMHWGHAVSKDLLHWDHLPIAIWPDELGYIFSGSCVYDRENTSGYGADGKAPVVAMFTSHGAADGLEQQSIAYSTDGIHFEKSYANPVIKNPGIPDFRDPKMFFNPVHNCWSMVLAAGDKILFYLSKDLKNWSKSGEFTLCKEGAAGICECPDCFSVETEQGTKWVLIVSMILKVEDEREKLHRTLYYVGDFDGHTFIADQPWEKAVWLDAGWDNYAAVTFQNSSIPILMGWASNWAYAAKTPTGEYCGQSTIPREISLKKTKHGYRMIQKPVGLESLRSHSFPIETSTILRTDSFGLCVTGEGEGSIEFSNDVGEVLLLQLTQKEILADRSKADEKGFHPFYAMEEFAMARAEREEEKIQMEILFDVSLLEVFAEEGSISITMSVYPSIPYQYITINGKMDARMYYLE